MGERQFSLKLHRALANLKESTTWPPNHPSPSRGPQLIQHGCVCFLRIPFRLLYSKQTSTREAQCGGPSICTRAQMSSRVDSWLQPCEPMESDFSSFKFGFPRETEQKSLVGKQPKAPKAARQERFGSDSHAQMGISRRYQPNLEFLLLSPPRIQQRLPTWGSHP